MYIYILDSLRRRSQLVDTFKSLIWTDRHRAVGDFQLEVNSTPEMRKLFVEGTQIVIAESKAIMTVETVEDVENDGERTLKITGRSMEKLLMERLARGDLDDLTTVPKWTLTGTPDAIAAQIFHDICVTGVLDSGDIIPGVIEDDSIFPTDTIAFPGDTIVYEIDMLSVYEAIRQLCEVYYMGFRLQRDGDTGDIYWDIYTGSDRTSAQTALPAIIFSPRLGNLQNAHSLKSIYMERNVAYVFSPVGYEIVYGFDVDPAVEGFDRRVIFVKADDITDTVPADASDKMIQRGKEALAKSRRIVAFDGQLTDTQNYVYGVDYNLGDLVEQRNDEGLTSVMQITEQIFVQDKEGFRSYPGLTFYQTIIDGEWYSYGPEVEWYDFTTEHWDDLPGG